jgi:hypothetical protein
VFGFEKIFAGFVKNAVGEVAGAQPDPFISSMLRWLGNIQAHAMLQWRATAASGIRCALRQKQPHTGQFAACPEPAIGACLTCFDAICLHHSQVNEAGEIICLKCMAEAVHLLREKHPERAQKRVNAGAGAGAPQVDKVAQRKAALKVLGLKDEPNKPATWDEIHAQFRALSIKHHPDRATAGKREAAQKRFASLSAAYHWLKEENERKAA